MHLLATDFLIKEIFLCIELGTLVEGFVPSEGQKSSKWTAETLRKFSKRLKWCLEILGYAHVFKLATSQAKFLATILSESDAIRKGLIRCII